MAKNIQSADPPRTEAPSAEATGGDIDPGHIEGRIENSLTRKIGKLISKHPKEALSVIRQWMSST